MSKQFRGLLDDLEIYLNVDVRPQLARIPTSRHKIYYAMYCAVRAATEVARMDVSPEKKHRLQHEIAERIAELL